MPPITDLAAEHGLLVVFAAVLAERLGAPIPSLPVILFATSLVVEGRLDAAALVSVAFVTSMLGDLAWYAAGRGVGPRVMRALCRISVNPDSCLEHTETFFMRWGVGSLLVAKFIPGLATIAPPLAGAMRIGLPRFVAVSAIGTLLWIGVGVAGGILFHDEVDRILAWLRSMGSWALVAMAGFFALFVAVKWIERHKLHRSLRMARISVDELERLIGGGVAPTIVDVRTSAAREIDQREIPGAIPVEPGSFEQQLVGVPRDRDIVVYCNCPNEASAARVARELMRQGFRRVRPLAGGLDAWDKAGFGTTAPVAQTTIAG